MCQHTHGLSNSSSSCSATMWQDTPCIQAEQLQLHSLVSPMTTSRHVAAGHLTPIAHTSGSIPSCYMHSCTASQPLTTTTNSTPKPIHISHHQTLPNFLHRCFTWFSHETHCFVAPQCLFATILLPHLSLLDHTLHKEIHWSLDKEQIYNH